MTQTITPPSNSARTPAAKAAPLDLSTHPTPEDPRERSVFESFNRAYVDCYGTDRGKLWVDRYPPGAAAYAHLVNARNRRVVDLCGSGDAVLDIGSGYGDLLYLLRDKYRSLQGVDPSAATIELATHNLHVRCVANEFRFQQAVAENLPFESGMFDSVTCLDTYEHIDPAFRHAALLEARRVVKPDGRVIIVTPSRARLRLWTVFDNLLTLRRQIRMWRNPKFCRPIEWARFPRRDFCEVFCSGRELRRQVAHAGFRVERFERVSFYPAPERGGFMYPFVEHKAADHWLVRAMLGFVRLVERLRVLNQKMLVVATPIGASALASEQVGETRARLKARAAA